MDNKKLNDIITKIMVIFPVITLLQGIPIFSYINKIMLGILVLHIFFCCSTKKITLSKILTIVITLILYIFSIIFTNGPLESINDLFYFGFWILFFVYLKDNINYLENSIKKNKTFILGTVIFWNLLVLLSVFCSGSFINKWDGIYFCSLANDCHRFASSCIFIIVLNFIALKETKKWYYFPLIFIPYISIFYTGARIYLLLLLALSLGIIYCLSDSKKKFINYSIIFLICSSCLVMFTPMRNKIMVPRSLNLKEVDFLHLSEQDQKMLIDSVTNTRTTFMKEDINGYLKLNFLKKLVGNGYNYVYDLNEIALDSRIWAHNDIINILLNYGLIGTLLYLFVLISFCISYYRHCKIPTFLLLIFIFIYFSNSMINMVYTYINATISLPFILYAFSLKNKVSNEITM